mmetsp:Transcript_116101/g.182673  ORF Transcript_116101/g.182673 Transcript_116101/m.182673 type:complete len:270 (-) Transcript_116101:52-861(-)|eukprot:CAMPEP_0169070616 /NCGR_PEP_ID=MMETSP1015-20121227/5209_1 /TAXON_ID=342587 /ORGANISM="Karlodinium micrum, Strain CCMP2283" /LENGTH=269 /DNA_ID=CAMNT_0009129623 /DNA_START=64 /DNA_END=873 /DNA_ORIENTATION=+
MPQRYALLLVCLFWNCEADISEAKEILKVKQWVPYFDYTGNASVTGGHFHLFMGAVWPRIGMTWSGILGMDPLCNKDAFYKDGGVVRKPLHTRADGSKGRAEFVNGCGIHVHKGTSCTESAGPHYFNESGLEQPTGLFAQPAPDPWIDVIYYLPGSGEEEVHTGFDELTDFVGRAMIIHDYKGNRIACGLLEGPYNATGENMTVVMVTDSAESNSNLLWVGIAASVLALLATLLLLYMICCSKGKGARQADIADTGEDEEEQLNVEDPE